MNFLFQVKFLQEKRKSGLGGDRTRDHLLSIYDDNTIIRQMRYQKLRH